MPTYTKHILSGSTGGRPIKVVATASAGTTIHTTGISATVIDEVWLYATNTDTAQRTLTIEFGGTTNPDDRIVVTIPAQSGLTILMTGQPLLGDGAAGRVLRAFASSANVVNVIGYVNRITP